MMGNPGKPANSGAGDTEGHWSDLKALFDSAISLPPDERDRYIERECGPNADLRHELKSLLQAYESTGDFLEQPVASLRPFADQFSSSHSEALHLPATEPIATVRPGERIGAYRLESELGRGGMGAVFLATRADGEFQHRVAIKLIRGGWESDFAVRRFRHERQILASLDHPHIARLLDGGTTDAGMPYFVMEYVDGRPVTNFCEEYGLNTQGRVQLFVHICSAVQYAHERNVIHRDLKPGNILVRADATPKLLDFGIAKLVATDASMTADATAAGFRLLTPAYASPEQMRGDAATVRSDVYSLGIILYELLWGERPSLSAIQRGLRSTGETQSSHLSPELQSIVFQAIQWDPTDRYGSVAELAEDLELYQKGSRPRSTGKSTSDTDTTSALVSIAILPLRFAVDQRESDAYLATGITDALVSRLSRVERLSVRPTSATLKYSAHPDTGRAARELKVKYILEGSVHRVNGLVRVSLQLVYAEASTTVWAAQFDQPAEDLIKLEESIAEEVASALLPRLSGEERAQISRAGTQNSKAHEAYLRGRWHWSRSAGDPEALKKALLCFSQAIAEDENYALAHAGLADYYLRLGLWGGLPPAESFAAAMDSAQRALKLDPSSGEAHASLGFASWAYRRDYRAAEQHFHLAIIRNPDYGSAHHWFGLLNSARNEPELAIANLERAHQVEPTSPVIVAALGFVHYNARDYGKAAQLLGEAAKELRNSAVVQEMLAWCFLKMSDARRALDCAQLAVAVSGRSPSALSVLAHALAASGDRAGALVLCGEIDEISRSRYVSRYDRASAYLAAGDVQRAINSLEAAVNDSDWWISWLGVEPRWDSLRQNGRFRKLVDLVQPKVEHDATTQIFHAARPRRVVAMAASALLLFLLASAAFLFWLRVSRRAGGFSDLRITKITANGIANAAAISPNGKFVAYTTLSGGKSALMLRESANGGARNLAPQLTGNIAALDFTNNGNAVSFVSYASEQASERTLFTVALESDQPTKILGPFGGGGAMTVDGSKAATITRVGKTDELWVHHLKTGVKQKIKTYLYPERFAWVCMPAWSPDGRKIAYAAEQRDGQGFLLRLFVIDVASGQTKEVRSPRWNWVQHLAWAGDGSSLAAVGQERDSPFRQIWSIPLNGGDVRRIGNDLDNYSSASITAGSKEMVSVQVRTESNIYIANPRDTAHPTQVTPGSGRYFDLAWTPEGKVLYASDATGSADLWMMNADGTGQKQLYSSAGRSYAPLMAPDGKNVVFHSNRTGNWQIWSVTAEGENPVQLSRSSRDGNWPQFTHDGRSVIYHQTDLDGSYNLWRVPVGGGEPTRLTTALTMHPAVSMKDDQIASWWSSTVATPQWKIAIFGPDGDGPRRIFDPTKAAYPDTTLRWTPSGTAITYLDHAKGIANIWLQSLDGSAPRQLTDFPSGEIYSFDWSRDNKLLYSRGLTTSDVVLIRDANDGNASK